MVDELALALASGIKAMSLRGGYTFQCQNCGKLILRNLKALQSGKSVVCSAPNCGAGYRLAGMEGDTPQMLRATVRLKCLRCSDEMAVDEGKVTMGVFLRCSKCDQRHRIVSQQWGYVKVDDATTGAN